MKWLAIYGAVSLVLEGAVTVVLFGTPAGRGLLREWAWAARLRGPVLPVPPGVTATADSVAQRAGLL